MDKQAFVKHALDELSKLVRRDADPAWAKDKLELWLQRAWDAGRKGHYDGPM